MKRSETHLYKEKLVEEHVALFLRKLVYCTKTEAHLNTLANKTGPATTQNDLSLPFELT